LDDYELVVGGWGDLYYTLIQLDIAGLPKRASSARLELFCFKQRGIETTGLYLDRITEFWDWRIHGTGADRERLWWADRPAATQWISTPLPPPAVGAWYAIDITDLYNSWQAGTYPNYGVQLRPTDNDNRWAEFYSSDFLGDPALRPRLVIDKGGPSDTELLVNGQKLHKNEETWVRFVAREVVPRLLGSREERLRVAARVSWWGLEEGIFSLPQPPACALPGKVSPYCFSSCTAGTFHNKRLGPLDTCAGIWQVGLAGIQVNDHSDQQVRSIIRDLFWPGGPVPSDLFTPDVTDIVTDIVRSAGFDPDQQLGASIVSATDPAVRKSWLLRDPSVGMTLEEPVVSRECIDGASACTKDKQCPSKSWSCLGGRCVATAWCHYKSEEGRQQALQSISDLTSIFDHLAAP
jgi:hypothetical protein